MRRALPVLLSVLACLQAVSTATFPLSGSTALVSGGPGEPAIVPVGWAFSIWGLVEALTIGYALWALVTRRTDAVVKEQLAAPLAVVCAGLSVWLAAVVVEPRWAPLAVFVVMVAALVRALGVARAHAGEIAGWSRTGRALLWGGLGVYAGWSSIAVWVNLTTALADSGAPVVGPVGVVGQLAVLAGATATACAIVWWTRGLLPYALAAAWALVGATAGAAGAGMPVLADAAVAGLVVVAGVTVVRRAPGRAAHQGR